MSTLGRPLRVWLVAAFVFFATPLTALLSLQCCLAHAPDSKPPDVHESSSDPDCPMHQKSADAESGCVLRGTCNGPLAVLANLLSQNGSIPESFDMRIDGTIELVAQTAPFPLTSAPSTLDSPPPRA